MNELKQEQIEADYIESQRPETMNCCLCDKEIGDYDDYYEVSNKGYMKYICEDCLEEQMTFDNALEFGRDNKVDVKINMLYSYYLTEEEIDLILKQFVNSTSSIYKTSKMEDTELKQAIKQTCENDKHDFARWLLEEKGEI